jgi:Spy/CpxP family protein refolding chaperone
MKLQSKILSLFFILSLFSANVAAQSSSGAAKRIQQEKVRYFTNQLELTPQEASKFWPVYNDYSARKSRINKEKQTTTTYYKNNAENLSEEEINNLLNDMIELKEKETELLKTYNDKFLNILPPEKVMNIYIAEVEFRQYLIKKLREIRMNKKTLRTN